MKGKELFYYLRNDELAEAMIDLGNKIELNFVKAGLFDDPNPREYNVLIDQYFLSKIQFGNWNLNHRYLVMPRNINARIRKVEQRRGGYKYAIDQMENPKSIVLVVGGEYTDGEDDFIIAGSLTTISDDRFATSTFKELKNIFSKKFRRKDNWYLGDSVDDKKHWLTTNVKLPQKHIF